MHGNEPAGVLALEEVFRLLEQEPQHNSSFSFRGRLIGVRGNIQAILANKRYLKKDLNRQFTLNNIRKVRSTTEKHLIAEDFELRAIVDLVDQEIQDYQPSQVVIIDLHTTTADGGIFSIAFSVALIQNKALIGDQVRGTRAASFWDKIYTPWTIDNEHGNSNGICCNG